MIIWHQGLLLIFVLRRLCKEYHNFLCIHHKICQKCNNSQVVRYCCLRRLLFMTCWNCKQCSWTMKQKFSCIYHCQKTNFASTICLQTDIHYEHKSIWMVMQYPSEKCQGTKWIQRELINVQIIDFQSFYFSTPLKYAF